MSKEQTSVPAKDQIDHANQFCKSLDLTTNGHGHYIYKCGPSVINLSYVLAEYASLQNAELQRENESLRKQLHEHNGICQEKLSEQLNSVLPEIKLLKEQNAELLKEKLELIDMLDEARALIEYMQEYTGPMGTCSTVLSRIESLIEKYTDKK